MVAEVQEHVGMVGGGQAEHAGVTGVSPVVGELHLLEIWHLSSLLRFGHEWLVGLAAITVFHTSIKCSKPVGPSYLQRILKDVVRIEFLPISPSILLGQLNTSVCVFLN